MRLVERTREDVYLHARLHTRGAAGSMIEVFDPVGVTVRASLLFEDGGIEETPFGLRDRRALRVLVPKDAPGGTGDRLVARGKTYEIRSVAEWTAHKEWVCRG